MNIKVFYGIIICRKTQIKKEISGMEQYKKEFIEFMIDCQVLKFGDFVTKSGRKTPFFVNTGYYRTGSQLKKLGEYYAKAILVGDQENILSGEIVFRPDSQVSKEGLAFSKVIIKETADVEEYFKNLIRFEGYRIISEKADSENFRAGYDELCMQANKLLFMKSE